MHNLWLALTVFSTTILAEILYFVSQGAPIEIPMKNFIGLFVALFFMSFIKNKKARLILMNLILGLSWFQMMHLQFYSIPVYPNAILLFFTQQGEIFYTLLENGTIFIIPLILVAPALSLNIFMDKKLTKKREWPYFHILFILYLLYNPMRTYFTGNTWGRQPSSQDLMGLNIYLSVSYFAGRILPFKVFNKNHKTSLYPNVRFSKTTPFDGNIIFVMGESLTSNHMSLFGYPKPTTIELDQYKKDPHFFFAEGISNAVSTDVAFALFFNNSYGLNGLKDLGLGKSCLFTLAKKSKFKTHFYSSQSTQQLRYITNSICPKNIDSFKSLEDIEPGLSNPNLANDHLLIDQLPDTDDDQKQHFFVLHQRGTHSPYKLRYKEHPRNFPLTEDFQKDRVVHYDNAVINFDLFMGKLLKKVKNYKKPTIIIYVSDHGEALGEEGIWGHAALRLSSLKIPILMYSHKTEQINYNIFKEKVLTQFNISLLISKLLGHQSQYSLTDHPPEYKALGNDLDGFAGYLDITFKDGKIDQLIRKDI